MELIEVAPLDRLQRIGDAVKLGIAGRIITNGDPHPLRMAPVALVAGAIALRREPREIGAILMPRAAAEQPNRVCTKFDAQDGGDMREVVEDGVVPVIAERTRAIPMPRGILGFVRKLAERINCGFDDNGHDCLP